MPAHWHAPAVWSTLSAHQRQPAQVSWIGRIGGNLAPGDAAIVRAVQAPFVSGPQLTWLSTRDDQWSDGIGRVGPAITNALPAALPGATVQPAIGCARAVRAVGTGRCGHDDDVCLPRIERDAPQIADFQACAG